MAVVVASWLDYGGVCGCFLWWLVGQWVVAMVCLLCYFNSCLNYFNELYAKIEPLMLVVL